MPDSQKNKSANPPPAAHEPKIFNPSSLSLSVELDDVVVGRRVAHLLLGLPGRLGVAAHDHGLLVLLLAGRDLIYVLSIFREISFLSKRS